MQIEFHGNNVYQGVELLLLVPMLFLLAIPKCLLIFKENFYSTSVYCDTCLFGSLLTHLEGRDESEADHRLGIPQLTFTEVDTRLLLVAGNQLVFCGNTWYIWLCEENRAGRQRRSKSQNTLMMIDHN